MNDIMRMASVSVQEKYLLTIDEASMIFGIKPLKLRSIARDNVGANWLLMNGRKYLIKRKQFEEYIDSLDHI